MPFSEAESIHSYFFQNLMLAITPPLGVFMKIYIGHFEAVPSGSYGEAKRRCGLPLTIACIDMN